MMFAVAITGPPFCAGVMVEVLANELIEPADVNAVEPESWLARGALLMVLGRPPIPFWFWNTGAVLFLRRGA